MYIYPLLHEITQLGTVTLSYTLKYPFAQIPQLVTLATQVLQAILQGVHIELTGICVPEQTGTQLPVSTYKAVLTQVMQYDEVTHCKHGFEQETHCCNVVF